MFAGGERSVDLVAVDADQGAVEDHERCAGPLGVAQRVPDARGVGGEQGDGFAGAPPRGRGRDAETGCKIAQGFAFAQVGEGEQGLGAGVEGPPAGADGPAVGADEGGNSIEGRGGQREGGRVEQQPGLLVVVQAEVAFVVLPGASSRPQPHRMLNRLRSNRLRPGCNKLLLGKYWRSGPLVFSSSHAARGLPGCTRTRGRRWRC